LRPTWAKLSRQRLYLKKKIQTKGLEAGQVAELFAYHKQGPGFNPHYHTHTKKKKKNCRQVWWYTTLIPVLSKLR
jgi:hypothetical protein